MTLETFGELVTEGTVRHVAASNYTAPRLAEAMATTRAAGARVARYVALQVHYNLVHREEYEEELEAVCRHEELSCLAYSALADGFLTGKYRPGKALPAGERSGDAAAYLNDHGTEVLGALDVVAARNATSVTSVALAWLDAAPHGCCCRGERAHSRAASRSRGGGGARALQPRHRAAEPSEHCRKRGR